MKSFVFEGKMKTTLAVFMVIGLVCLIASWFAEPAALEAGHSHMRFWSNFLHNTVFFTGMSFLALFVLTAFTTAWAGWYTQFKRLYEALAAFLVPGLVLLTVLIVGLYTHGHHLYHWAAEGIATPGHENYDKIIAGKSAFLNKSWYTFGTFIVVGVWILCWYKIRQHSLAEDKEGDESFYHHKMIRRWSAGFLPFAAFSVIVVICLWVMSIDAHWYSTLFFWYNSASLFVAMNALTILLLIWMKSKGYYPNITDEHLHDLGKFLFAFSVFWTYLWFSQYMLIWYANNGEETIYFKERVTQYPILWYGNLVINFVLPFFVLMRNSNKRKYGTLILISVLTFFGHWWDFFYMIKPGTYKTGLELAQGHGHAAEGAHEAGHHAAHAFTMGFTIPGFLEIGIGLGFLAAFLFVTFSTLAKAALIPTKDPYLEESLHHEVMQAEGDHH